MRRSVTGIGGSIFRVAASLPGRPFAEAGTRGDKGTSVAQDRQLVWIEGGIPDDDREVFELCLGDQHPIERISVTPRESARTLRMVEGDWQRFEPFVQSGRSPE